MPTLTIPLGKSEWYSSNDRIHQMQRYRIAKAVRAKAKLLAKQHLEPITGPVHVTAFIGYPKGVARADPSNASVLKHILDGLTDAGIWGDDDSEHIPAVAYRRDASTGRTGLWTVRLEITRQNHEF